MLQEFRGEEDCCIHSMMINKGLLQHRNLIFMNGQTFNRLRLGQGDYFRQRDGNYCWLEYRFLVRRLVEIRWESVKSSQLFTKHQANLSFLGIALSYQFWAPKWVWIKSCFTCPCSFFGADFFDPEHCYLVFIPLKLCVGTTVCVRTLPGRPQISFQTLADRLELKMWQRGM